MKQILGLDLGTNSIGWAVIENGGIKNSGVRTFLSDNRVKSFVIHNYLRNIHLTKNEIMTLSITATTGLISMINIPNWKFWLGLSVASFLTFLSKNK